MDEKWWYSKNRQLEHCVKLCILRVVKKLSKLCTRDLRGMSTWEHLSTGNFLMALDELKEKVLHALLCYVEKSGGPGYPIKTLPSRQLYLAFI